MSRKTLFAFLVLAALSPACADVQPQNYYGKIAKRLGAERAV
jgi:hypothetical protein